MTSRNEMRLAYLASETHLGLLGAPLPLRFQNMNGFALSHNALARSKSGDWIEIFFFAS